MAALGGVVVACGVLLAALRLWLDYLRERDATRHRWRMEAVEVRAAAWKADVLEELRQRVQKLELRVTR